MDLVHKRAHHLGVIIWTRSICTVFCHGYIKTCAGIRQFLLEPIYFMQLNTKIKFYKWLKYEESKANTQK